MINYINYNGQDSRNFGLLVSAKDSYNQPERDVEYISVPGRNGDLVFDNGRYKNINISYSFTLVAETLNSRLENPNYGLQYAIKDINKWLISDGNYHKLYDSYNPDYYRFAECSGGISHDVQNPNFAKFSVTFNCKPYRYRTDGDNVITVMPGNTIYNPEAFDSTPYLKIYASSGGTVSFSLNGVSVSIQNVTDYVEMDCDIQNVYKGSANKNSDFTGGFPMLKSGNNGFGSLTNITKIDIIPRWRAL